MISISVKKGNIWQIVKVILHLFWGVEKSQFQEDTSILRLQYTLRACVFRLSLCRLHTVEQYKIVVLRTRLEFHSLNCSSVSSWAILAFSLSKFSYLLTKIVSTYIIVSSKRGYVVAKQPSISWWAFGPFLRALGLLYLALSVLGDPWSMAVCLWSSFVGLQPNVENCDRTGRHAASYINWSIWSMCGHPFSGGPLAHSSGGPPAHYFVHPTHLFVEVGLWLMPEAFGPVMWASRPI